MALKLTVFLAVGTVFLSTTRVEEFSYALSCFGLPHKIAFTITLSFRLVPVFLQTAQMVVEAQRCRGLNFDQGSVWRRARRYIPVMVPVFMGALRRTEGLAMALDARGFQLERKRTTYRAYRLGRGDLLAIAGLSALLLSYAYLRRSGQLAIF
jgi:energy-coupling factor transport system permease protein